MDRDRDRTDVIKREARELAKSSQFADCVFIEAHMIMSGNNDLSAQIHNQAFTRELDELCKVAALKNAKP